MYQKLWVQVSEIYDIVAAHLDGDNKNSMHTSEFVMNHPHAWIIP